MARVLVVDDDADIRELVGMKLTNAGHDVLLAVDGTAGFDAMQTERPDLVVLDWMMPGRTGIEFCRALREDQATARTGVLLLTARAQEADIERGLAAGADDYLVKPFSARELVGRVQTILARAR